MEPVGGGLELPTGIITENKRCRRTRERKATGWGERKKRSQEIEMPHAGKEETDLHAEQARILPLKQRE